MRVYDLVCGVVFAVLAGLKLLDGTLLLGDGVRLMVAGLEVALAVSWFMGKAPRGTAIVTALLGGAFCFASLCGGIAGRGGPGCGCLGPLIPSFLEHLTLSALVLALGSGRLWMLGRQRDGGEATA